MYKIACNSLLTGRRLLQFSLPVLGLSFFIASGQALAKLEPSVSYQETVYQLCAKQRVTKALLFDVVDVGVYYPSCEQADNIFDQQPKLLRFSYLREVEGIQFTEGANEFLQDNLTNTEKETCQEDYQQFNTIYEDVSDGDYYDLFVLPGQGLDLYLNEAQLAKFGKGECAVPYLNIWFGSESMDSDFEELSNKIKVIN